MALLVGKHVNKVDRKGRVSVPKPFRAVFDQEGFAGLYVQPSFKFPALEAMGESFMNRLVAAIEEKELYSDDYDDLSALVESTEALGSDPEGRITLPEELRAHAGITDQVLFVGRGRTIQLWDPATYAARRGDAFAQARARGVTLKLPPAPPAPPASDDGEGR